MWIHVAEEKESVCVFFFKYFLLITNNEDFGNNAQRQAGEENAGVMKRQWQQQSSDIYLGALWTFAAGHRASSRGSCRALCPLLIKLACNKHGTMLLYAFIPHFILSWCQRRNQFFKMPLS